MMPNHLFYEPSDSGEFVPAHIIYLNVSASDGVAMNGVVYVLEMDELEAFDRREWIYDRKRVTPAIRDLIVQSGDVYTYAAKPEWILDASCTREWAAVRRSYLDIIDAGLKQLGPAFRKEFEASTDPVRWDLVFNDRKRSGTHPLLAELSHQKEISSD